MQTVIVQPTIQELRRRSDRAICLALRAEFQFGAESPVTARALRIKRWHSRQLARVVLGRVAVGIGRNVSAALCR